MVSEFMESMLSCIVGKKFSLDKAAYYPELKSLTVMSRHKGNMRNKQIKLIGPVF